MMRTRWTLVLVMLALPRLASAEPVKVAIVPGITVNLDAARVDVLSQDLARALTQELEVEAIGGVEVRRKLPEAGLQPDCVANQACIDDVARRLEVQQLLFVVMIDTGTGGAIQVDSTWVDVASRQSASRPAIDIAAITEAKQRFADAARQLLPDAPVRPKPHGLGQLSPPVPRHMTWPAYATAGAAIVGLGVGIGFGLSTRTKYKDCEDLPMGRECSNDQQSSIRSTGLIADIGWAVALGGAIATAVLYGSSAEASHIIVEPAPGGAAVTAVGKF